MNNITKLSWLLFSSLFISLSSLAQTTEVFEDDVVGATTFTDNGQNFTITNGAGETNYDIETFAGAGWNGTGPDNNFVDNSGLPAPTLGNGSSFTISTSDGADIYINSLYLFMSQFNLTAASGFTLIIQGRQNGSLVYSISKNSGFSNTTTFSPNNGFTFIDFATEGGSNNSNTLVDELVITTTGNADYVALDAINWEPGPVCTNPTVPTVTASTNPICSGGSTTLNISGTLNDATQWHVYTGFCGVTPVGTTSGTTFTVSPTSNTSYFVRGEGGCVAPPGTCGAISITVNPTENAGFNYSSSSYCANDSDPTPTITGVSGGSFSTGAGLSINAGTGAIDVSTSTPGTYTVTYTTPGACPGTSTQSITINALDDASFNYSSATYCTSDSDPTPTITGLGGGSFSSGGGLSINAGTGAIDVSASTPGTYTVTYTTSGSCPNSSNVSVTISATDNAGFNYSASSYCVNDSDPTPTITGALGGTFSSTAGLSINAGTGAIDVSVSTPGTYTVTYTTSGTCPNSSNVSVTVNALDDPSFNYSSATYCSSDSDPTPTITGLGGGSFSSTAGLSINAGTGAIDVSASTPGTYTVTYTTTGSCTNSSNVSITINAADDASFNYGAATYCVNDADPTPTITGLLGGSFSAGAGLSINAGTGAIDVSVSTPGTYTVTYTTAGVCSNSSNVSVTINALDAATFFYSGFSHCQNGSDPSPTITGLTGGTFSSTAGISLNASTGAVDVSASTPGIYLITYATTGACPNSSSVNLSVVATDNASFSYSAGTYCSTDSDPTPTVTGFGTGSFSGGAGLVINAGTGEIDLSASIIGTYTVTYTTAGPCPNSSNVSVTINVGDDASFNYSASAYCVNDTDPTPTITGLAGGAFSSGAGLSMNASTGAIDVSVSTPGTYTVTYTTTGSCPSSSNVSITINALDDASFNYSASSYCVNATDPTPTITGLAGGSFSSTAGLSINAATGVVDLSASTAGTYIITYTTSGSCPNSSSVSVTINSMDDASFNYDFLSFCISSGLSNPTVTGLAGGTFSSTPGLILDPSTGIVNATGSTVGTYIITYTTAGSCPNSSNVSFTLVPLDDASFSYSASAFCVDGVDPIPTITGLPGGTFVSAPWVSINASTGEIDLSATTPANTGVTYTTSGTCPNSSNVSLSINALDDASFGYSASAYCVDGADPTPTITGLAGGSFSSTAGLSINASTGAIDLSLCTPGTYAVSYATSGTCPNNSSVSVTVNALDDASFSYSASGYCLGEPDPTPTITGLAGGVFTSAPGGLNINPSTGFINIGLSLPGSYTVSYTTAGLCPNSSSVSVAIGTPPAAPTVVTPLVVCPGSDVILSATGSGTGSIQFFDGTPTLIGTVPMPPATATFNVGALAIGTYTFAVSEFNGACNSLPTTIVVNVGDIVPPTASCQNITVFLDGAGSVSIVGADVDNGSTDNCGPVTLSVSPNIFTCSNLGVNTVTLTATDGLGNSSTCTSTVTVLDTVSPTASCQDITVFLDGAGAASIVASDLDNGSTDNCSTVSLAASNTSFTCADLGANSVILTVTDGSGNTSTCTSTVTVADSTSPIASCQNITVFLDGAGTASIVAADLDNGSTDNCGSITLSASPSTFTCADLGANTVTLTVTDGSGNSSTCTSTVTISDTVSPTASCQDLTVLVDGAGNATIVAGDIDNGSTDNCSTVSLAASTTSFTCADLGANTVTLTVTDGSGNTSTCTSTVTVADSTSPTASCQDITVFLDGAGTASIVAGDLDNGSADNCSTVSLAASTTSFTCADLGANMVTLTVTDGSGNTSTCTSTVTISDTVSPTASCQDITIFLDGAGTASIVAADLDNGSTDNCGTLTLSASPTIFTCADLGANTVTLTVTDGSGNTSTCTSTVTVADSTSPTASCQDITVFLDGAGAATIVAADLDNGSSDNCSTVSLAASTTSFTCADLGANTVILTVTDGSGNTSTCTSTVTVADSTSPTASCQDITVFLDGAGTASIVAADLNNGSIDNCGPVILSASTTTFTCVDLGANTVTLTVTDGSGNTSTCTSTVTVSDTVSPTASCQDITIFLDGAGTASIVAADIDNGSTDNCSTVSLAASTTTFTCSDLGANTVMLTVTDGSGNTSTCTSTVTVADSTSPMASCQDVTVFLDGTGVASIVAADLDNGSIDNCGSITLSASPTTFTCADLGANTVTLTVTDGSGNTSTCTSTVTVSDTVSPTASCQDITIFLDGAGTASIVAADIDNGSTDNCSTVTLAASTTTFACSDVGANTVTLSVTDIFGNVSTCTSTVTVLDTISPIVSCTSGIQNISDDGTGDCTFTPFIVGQAGSYDLADNCADPLTVVEVFTGALNTTSTFSLPPGAGYTPVQAFPVGVTNVTVTVTDASGNSSSCSYTTTILDDEAPTATCQDITVFLDGTGTASIVAADIDNGSFDNCSAVTVTASDTAFTCADLGANTVTLTVTDGSGNTSTCTSTVTVADTIAPTASCQDITVFLDGAGTASIAAADIDNGSSDNCTTVTLSASTTSFTCADLGANTVILSVTDIFGNTSTCTSSVTVADTISPTITCPGDVIVNNDLGLCSASGVVLGSPTLGDNCSGTTASNDGLTTYPVGVTNVTWTVTDASGNTSQCIQTVTVVDNEAPVLPTILDVNVECGVTIPVPAATDNCAGTVLGSTTDPLTYTSQGTFVINWTFDDGSGNVVTATQNVVVSDVTAPLVVNALPDVTDECSATVIAPIANDACAGAVTGTTTTVFPITTQGITVVTWTYDDGNGNISSQNQNVIIDDVTLPVPDVTTLTDITAECEVTTLTPPTATDNCSGTLVGTTNVTLPITSQGTTVVTWFFDDGNGNISSQDQSVIINDVTAPVPDVPVLTDVTGECSAVVTSPTATDACGGVVINGTTTDPVVYTTQGTYTVTWSYTDANGNTSTQTQTVIVNDVTPPVADATILTDVIELCSATLSAPTATDNCSGLITGTTTTAFPITTSTVVTWTYDDGNGNVSTQDQIVTIDGVDVSTTLVSSIEVTANNANGDSYQWIDCDNGNVPVANGTNQNFVATANGSYAVIINEDGCIDTSACIIINSVGVDEEVQLDFNIYPNPVVDGKFTISFDGQIEYIELQDLQGRIIMVLHSTSTGEVNVSDLARGKYFVRVTTASDQLLVKSIIIQ